MKTMISTFLIIPSVMATNAALATGPVYNFNFHNGTGTTNNAPVIQTPTQTQVAPVQTVAKQPGQVAEEIVVTEKSASSIKGSKSIVLGISNINTKHVLGYGSMQAKSVGLKYMLSNNFSLTGSLLFSETFLSNTDFHEYSEEHPGVELKLQHQGEPNFLGFIGLQGGLKINHIDSPSGADFKFKATNVLADIGLRMELGDFALIPSINFGKSYQDHYATSVNGAALQLEISI